MLETVHHTAELLRESDYKPYPQNAEVSVGDGRFLIHVPVDITQALVHYTTIDWVTQSDGTGSAHVYDVPYSQHTNLRKTIAGCLFRDQAHLVSRALNRWGAAVRGIYITPSGQVFLTFEVAPNMPEKGLMEWGYGPFLAPVREITDASNSRGGEDLLYVFSGLFDYLIHVALLKRK